MEKIKPIDLLKAEMLKWENEYHRIHQEMYHNDTSIGTDNHYRLLRIDLAQCREMLRLYLHNIRKLKK